MMEFRIVKDAIVKLLGDNAGGRFRVLGYIHQVENAEEFKHNDRLVHVYYTDGQFPKSSGRMIGSKTHDLTVNIDMAASAAASGDITALNRPGATPQEKAAAIAAIKDASEVADTQIDEMIEYIYMILMDARNIDLGLPKGEISSRWIGEIKKDTIVEGGDLVLKTANMKYTCRVQEVVFGDIGFHPDHIIIDSSLTGDISSAGVKTNEVNN